ncbi:hypothetical protein TUBRATIS_21520 [Tubulinosema ratisbonensis]|uniref:Uncharacterized protein n=1 Tax=Tubulinosema ratisbonensis TaxID=291195 RepID=A0A437AJV4_9MICR|nr:hypothetical protein TUBRATIS_21520 [Tubulinosema ratisbonensis]
MLLISCYLSICLGAEALQWNRSNNYQDTCVKNPKTKSDSKSFWQRLGFGKKKTEEEKQKSVLKKELKRMQKLWIKKSKLSPKETQEELERLKFFIKNVDQTDDVEIEYLKKLTGNRFRTLFDLYSQKMPVRVQRVLDLRVCDMALQTQRTYLDLLRVAERNARILENDEIIFWMFLNGVKEMALQSDQLRKIAELTLKKLELCILVIQTGNASLIPDEIYKEKEETDLEQAKVEKQNFREEAMKDRTNEESLLEKEGIYDVPKRFDKERGGLCRLSQLLYSDLMTIDECKEKLTKAYNPEENVEKNDLGEDFAEKYTVERRESENYLARPQEMQGKIHRSEAQYDLQELHSSFTGYMTPSSGKSSFSLDYEEIYHEDLSASVSTSDLQEPLDVIPISEKILTHQDPASFNQKLEWFFASFYDETEQFFKNLYTPEKISDPNAKYQKLRQMLCFLERNKESDMLKLFYKKLSSDLSSFISAIELI